MRRRILGILALSLLSAAAVLWITQPAAQERGGWLAICLRLGVVMAALWLALPELSRISRWSLGAVLLGAVLIATQPRLFLLALGAALVLAFLRPRWNHPA